MTSCWRRRILLARIECLQLVVLRPWLHWPGGQNQYPCADKIVGPGNAYVAAAKRAVFGRVGIDMIAGPSEILVVADDTSNPDWVAMDLFSQAEHDEQAQPILVSCSKA